MKNLHKIIPFQLTDEDKRIIAAFYKHAYLPGSSDRRIKFAHGKVYYRPYSVWREFTQEWKQDYWRDMWLRYPDEPFNISMVIIVNA